ncbi:MAG: ssl1498 family light-harvesting-like protein [Xenococcaceae cyanobacterium MO_188.B19]|nr:ssl1498 family light-harvesting-like protein [Xenococcaceae cyanobacterium MO_188.B19]
MYTTTQLDNGTLNNYAVEPEMTYAEYPTLWEQKNYLKQGAVAALFVTALVLVSFVVS